ncbi:helix-turn-helix transcriptional regulator [Agrilactobacillus fermenti]|uniref:helix-turn-helix transcriptional regulator n=1 Tax=Agrilactobacillus fermenti TaxID=2586909 RepID=UPI001E2B5A01|nr:helix-turn-helix domain-containing protein [Agrilactobacillus fermenti]MCD2256056.1 helix-turn-helix domain-containing protein [Agrilactobacillus fermenti]
MILFDEKLSERLKQPLLQLLKPLTSKVIIGSVRHAAYVLLQTPIDLTTLVAKWQTLSGLPNSVLVWAADVHFAAVHHIITLAKGAFTDSFYYDHSILVNANDLKPHRQDTNQFISAYQAEMQRLISKNDFIAAQAKTRLFFQAAKDEHYDVEFLKVTCQQLVDQLIKTTKIKVNEELTLKIIYAANYLDLQATILNVIESIKRHTYIGHGSGNIVADLNLIIEKNFDNPNLSLRWIANNLLFLNSEYLGKVYAHQTNKRFTEALTDYRVNVAKAMLRQGDKVYEVANAVGYQNNTDYFSKQFKKRTGLTPKQYQLKKK